MIHEGFAGWPPALVVLVLAAVPLLELRAALPVAVLVYGMGYGEAILLSVLGTIAPVPFLMVTLPHGERWVRRSARLARLLDGLFARTRRRSSRLVQRFEEAGLALFVAVPLPGTGAWTGTLAAYLLGLPRGGSLLSILVGVVLSAVAVAALVASGRFLWVLAV